MGYYMCLLGAGLGLLAGPQLAWAGGSVLNLTARVQDATCPLVMTGTSSGALDLGTYSVIASGPTTSTLRPSVASGQTQTTTVSLKTDPDCSVKGVLVLDVSGYNENADGKATLASTDVYSSSAPTTVGCMTATVDGEPTPYCLPYAVSVKDTRTTAMISANMWGPYAYFVGAACILNVNSTYNHVVDRSASCNSGKGAVSTTDLRNWATVLSRGKILVSHLYLNNGCSYFGTAPNANCSTIGPSTATGSGVTGAYDVSAMSLQFDFTVPQRTNRWAGTPPPSGTVFSGQLVLTSSYL